MIWGQHFGLRILVHLLLFLQGTRIRWLMKILMKITVFDAGHD
jgi:hypothetical protein